MRKHTYADLQNRVFEGLLFTEKFRKYELSAALAMSAQALGLTRRELKPLFQKFKNNCKLSDDQLKEKYEAIEREFDEEFDKAMGGVQ
jgi:hypothetical protein